ncbi:MAG: universal stress protein, partial [Ilumatobacteraceae bacterium]
EILVGNVFEPDQAEVSPDDFERLIAEAEHNLNAKWSEPLHLSGVPHGGLQLIGAPDSLLDAAEAEHVDLLVVGTRGTGHLAGLHLGSMAHHLAHLTRGPLAIVPSAGATATIDRIVVGVDGSAGSESAVSWCAGLAAACNADVIAICAFEPHPRWGSSDRDVATRRAAVEAAVSSVWVAPLRDAGVTFRTRVVEGKHPGAALASAATDEGAGLLVVGTRGLNDVVGSRLARMPLQLVHHTHLPVILIPPNPMVDAP